MILTGREIQRQHGEGRVRISEFDPLRVTTNSYDLRLGSRLLRYTGQVLDPRIDNPHELFTIPPEGFVMQPGDFLLGETAEALGSDHYVPLIHAKSGTARLGLFVHITADLIDIGSYGKSTLQLYATLPVVLHAGMELAQVTFWRPHGEISLYRGKYLGTDRPLPSQSWRDWADR